MTDGLNRPLVALELAPEEHMLISTLKGEKEITIRAGWRDYRENERVIIFCAVHGFVVDATITSVRHCLLHEVDVAEMNADGWTDHKTMCEDLGRFYPDMSMNSKVSVIRWTDVRGPIVDDFRAQDTT
jgi:hypothetical protein